MWKPSPHTPSADTPPNVIFLGIDSLRPDALTADTAPNIRAFMDGAMQLTDAVTPLARTFPAWASILTGRHPHTTGAYMNLLPRELIHTGATLPQLLREHGYQTGYAIDETRFSNIDASYGFDRTAAPTMGGSDFVLAWFADTPLSNTVMNTRLGALLFPHVHGNRAAHVTYDPDSFVRRIEREFDFDQPTFLAAHLTLPHWPFTWATSPADAPNADNAGTLYRDAVRRADRQFGDLLAVLQRRGALDHALVVVFSDHGEALGQPDDFMRDFFPEKDDAAIGFQKWGHGTSVFSPHQYRVVLGVRAYGAARTAVSHHGLVDAPVSLADLTPTILDLLNIESTESFDGRSLAPLLQSGADSAGELAGRIRFTESEYNPQGFSVDQLTPSALAAAARVYQLDPVTDRITVRSSLIEQIMSTRQYAALLGDSFAAAVPNDAAGGKYRFFYQPASEPGNPQEQARLRQALEERFDIRFGDEIHRKSLPQ
jgi:arylsulfatase A-like enzyme